MNKKRLERKEKFNQDCMWLFKKTIYHRGVYDNKSVFENTLPAFKKAIEKKAAFEFDVQLTNDLQVVCIHDTSMKRFFNRERDIKDISYKRLNKIRDDLQVPLLKDVLKEVNGKVELVIELKHVNSKYNSELVKRVYELLKDYKGKYVIVSFNQSMLRAYRSLDKDAYIGRNISSSAPSWFAKLMVTKDYFNFVARPDFISAGIENFDEQRLAKFKAKEYKIVGWTLKESDNKKQLKKYFDNFIIEESL